VCLARQLRLDSVANGIWQYFKLIRVHAQGGAGAHFNIRCFDDAKGCLNADAWNIELTIPVSAKGHADLGPSLYAALVGARFGVHRTAGANIALAAGMFGSAFADVNRKAGRKAGSIYAALLKYGPDAICNGALPNFEDQ
jgi:hypothetical protein